MTQLYFQRVALLVASDIDALCACKILQVGNNKFLQSSERVVVVICQIPLLQTLLIQALGTCLVLQILFSKK